MIILMLYGQNVQKPSSDRKCKHRQHNIIIIMISRYLLYYYFRFIKNTNESVNILAVHFKFVLNYIFSTYLNS